MSEVDDFRNRLPFDGEPRQLLGNIIEQYELGGVKDFQIVTSGFEDCNFIVESDDKKLFVKCYAKSRTPEDIDRSINILDAIADTDIHHPHLYRTSSGLLSVIGQVNAVVMDYIDGKSFHALGRPPTDEEAKLVVAEAVKINSLDINPPFIYDSIAIVNIADMWERVRSYMTDEDQAIVKPVVDGFEYIGIDDLPKAFVHGDLITTNVILDKSGKIWIVDFSVANRYPRIQELAVIASSLMHGNGEPLKVITDKVAKAYEAAGGVLVEPEKSALFTLARSAQAMELMGGYQYIYVNKDNVEEARHWQEVGRKGLRASGLEKS